MTNKQDQTRLDSASTFGTIENNQSLSPGGGFFEIRVKGHLNHEWSDWLGGLEMTLKDNGEMILFGHIVDQAALMGVVNKLNRLNLILVSINKVNQVNRKMNKETK